MIVPRVCLEEIAMAKAKKRVAARKKSSKRGKANAKPARKMAAKKATPKKAKSKVQRAGMSAKKPAPKKKQALEPMEKREVAAMPVATFDVIEEPAPPIGEFRVGKTGIQNRGKAARPGCTDGRLCGILRGADHIGERRI
jgi:hypothetical protein